MNIAEKKRINSILFFASKNPDKKIERLKLMKLLWLSDRVHLNKYGRTILDDTYYAIKCGPILSNTMDLSNKSITGIIDIEGFIIEAQKEPDLSFFSNSDLDVMNLIWSNFGNLEPSKLVQYSHKFPEWKRFGEDLKKGPVKRFKIIMEDFFEAPKDHQFKSLVTLSKDSTDIIKNEYRNSNALVAWLNS